MPKLEMEADSGALSHPLLLPPLPLGLPEAHSAEGLKWLLTKDA